MDICVSSNFECYLFELADRDPAILNQWMKDFEVTKELTLSGDVLRRAQSDFVSAKADTKQTLAVIRDDSTPPPYYIL